MAFVKRHWSSPAASSLGEPGPGAAELRRGELGLEEVEEEARQLRSLILGN